MYNYVLLFIFNFNVLIILYILWTAILDCLSYNVPAAVLTGLSEAL